MAIDRLKVDGRPFVLLDDARSDGPAAARLFDHPVDTLVAGKAEELPGLIDALQDAQLRGLHVAGYLGYEAGRGFAAAWRSQVGAHGQGPLGWFGLFERVERIDADAVASLLPDPDAAWIGTPQPRVARADYEAAVARVLDYIRAGDIYQANLTFRADVPFAGDPLAVYARLRADGAGGMWRFHLDRRAGDRVAVARAFLCAARRRGDGAADEGHGRASRRSRKRRAGGAGARAGSQAACRKSDDRRPAPQRSVARCRGRIGRGARPVSRRNLSHDSSARL